MQQKIAAMLTYEIIVLIKYTKLTTLNISHTVMISDISRN